MNSRERVWKALNYETVDRVPIDLGAHRSSGIAAMAYAKLKRALGSTTGDVYVFDMVQQLAIVEPDRWDGVKTACERWDLDATIVGEVTDTKHLRVFWHGEMVGDMDAGALAEPPTYDIPRERPAHEVDEQAGQHRIGENAHGVVGDRVFETVVLDLVQHGFHVSGSQPVEYIEIFNPPKPENE